MLIVDSEHLAIIVLASCLNQCLLSKSALAV